ncbi:hypothetical protein TKK_0019678 [Trichogramma kaykai]
MLKRPYDSYGKTQRYRIKKRLLEYESPNESMSDDENNDINERIDIDHDENGGHSNCDGNDGNVGHDDFGGYSNCDGNDDNIDHVENGGDGQYINDVDEDHNVNEDDGVDSIDEDGEGYGVDEDDGVDGIDEDGESYGVDEDDEGDSVDENDEGGEDDDDESGEDDDEDDDSSCTDSSTDCSTHDCSTDSSTDCSTDSRTFSESSDEISDDEEFKFDIPITEANEPLYENAPLTLECLTKVENVKSLCSKCNTNGQITYLMEIPIIDQLKAIQQATAIYGYDCGTKLTNLTTISMLDVGKCKEERPEVRTTRIRAQLVQVNDYGLMKIKECKVLIKRMVFYCGMHSHISLVANGEIEYYKKITQEECDGPHQSGT